ncbi:MAG TPA: glycosyltransferase 87 family protein [Candidatus Baltobacteraceae bacterium]|nr:glycosyltransferase 87 family protein [Candidatus Baltobacteraceae bacterium]
MIRAWLLAAAALAVLVALLFARPHPTPGPPMRDFEAYYAAGALWNHGGDAYSQAIWNVQRSLGGANVHRYEALPFAGPPALLPVFGALAHLPFDAANKVWRGILIAALAALALVTLRLAQQRITLLSCAGVAVAALGFGPLTSALALGQIALPAFLFASAAMLYGPAALLAWMQPNVGLTLLSQLFTRRWWAFAASAALFAAACAFAVGIEGLQNYLALLHRHAAAEQLSAIQLTPAAVAYGFGAPAPIASSIGTAVALAAACCWLAAMRRARDAVAGFCLTCALLPLAMPFFHEHDLLVLFVPAIVYSIRADARVGPVAVAGALLAATDWLGLAQRPDGTLQTLLLVGALGAALVALHESPRLAMLKIPVCVLALIGIAAIFAHAHPAPVWPDAMRALPHGIERLDIASAWNAQQRATGLFARDPVWAALRLLSLLGCALTAGAVAVSSRSAADSRTSSPVPV